MTSIPIPFYWPNGWSRTSREQPGAPLLSVSGSVTRMNRWTKSANSSDPGDRPIDSKFPFCSPSAVRRPHPCLGRAIATCGGDVGSRQASHAGGCATRGDEDLEVNLAGIVMRGVLSRNDYD